LVLARTDRRLVKELHRHVLTDTHANRRRVEDERDRLIRVPGTVTVPVSLEAGEVVAVEEDAVVSVTQVPQLERQTPAGDDLRRVEPSIRNRLTSLQDRPVQVILSRSNHEVVVRVHGRRQNVRRRPRNRLVVTEEHSLVNLPTDRLTAERRKLRQ